MVQQTYQGPPDDVAPGDVIRAAHHDKLREFLLALVKDGTEDTTGQTFNLLLSGTDGNAELEGRELGTVQTYTPTIGGSGSLGGSVDTSSAAGNYVVVGNMCTVWARFVVSSNDDAGDLRCSLPIAADTSLGSIAASTTAGSGTVIGSMVTLDASSGNAISGNAPQLRTAGSIMFVGSDDPLQADDSKITGSGDVLTFQVTYPVASA